MASSVSRPVPFPASSRRWEDDGVARRASLLVSLVGVLFAAVLIATPPLALLTAPSDTPATPAPHTGLTVSQFA
ncbi:hypothetical protein V5F38_18370 [Xanthobacter sp. V0B-10]|uniref:hypothetical protein n=1 Tax=Xanthobacter albus TaxID=3119929 RepID=UPI0037287B60